MSGSSDLLVEGVRVQGSTGRGCQGPGVYWYRVSGFSGLLVEGVRVWWSTDRGSQGPGVYRLRVSESRGLLVEGDSVYLVPGSNHARWCPKDPPSRQGAPDSSAMAQKEERGETHERYPSEGHISLALLHSLLAFIQTATLICWDCRSARRFLTPGLAVQYSQTPTEPPTAPPPSNLPHPSACYQSPPQARRTQRHTMQWRDHHQSPAQYHKS